MPTYSEFRREGTRKKIQDLYAMIKDELSDKLKKVPLREFTYGGVRDLEDKDGRILTVQRALLPLLDQYIEKYNLPFDKDITLEEAVNKI